jgi:hypothetical protein
MLREVSFAALIQGYLKSLDEAFDRAHHVDVLDDVVSDPSQLCVLA